MQTEAVFENIADRIRQEICKAQKSVCIAVAWFTNKDLFNELMNKARNGCAVSLIISNDRINQNSHIDFEQLNLNNSRVYKVGDGDTELMHNKFCVIDYSTVITGSYNWSYKAETNFENVIVNYNDTALAEQFIAEFNQIRNRYYPDEQKTETVFPINIIIKRLEILRNYIILEDTTELQKETGKLSVFNFNADILEITTAVNSKSYADAILKIQNFISRNQQLALWNDPVLLALKLEIKNLENQLNAFDNEKVELEKLLNEFHHRHTIELGSIIIEILKLRKLKFKEDKVKFEEAEEDFKNYNSQFEAEKERRQYELNDDEKQELKQKFRKASFICHPDKVNDAFKAAAEKIFIELKAAYEASDLKKVSEILNDLENGNSFKSKSETVSEKEILKVEIEKLRRQIKILEIEIINIRESETYKQVISIEDWDAYFGRTKEKLAKELENLKAETEAVE